jgi:CubicO group peptidase (beta-lactamase class C family)
MLKKIGKALAGILVIVILVASIIVAINVDFSNPSDLDNFVHNKMKKTDVPGVSIAIIKDHKINQSIHYGYANIEKNKKINDETVFQIASLSKVVTATSIMQLYEKKKLDLDDQINKYLPVKVVHPHFPNEPITVRMLLDHTSGLNDNWDVLDGLYTIRGGGGDSDISFREFTEEYLTEKGHWYSKEKNFTENKPGSTFVYSNVGYGMLGYIAEQVSQESFDQLSTETIFEPLEMTQTAWLHKDVITDNFADPYEGDKELPRYSFPTYPDGSLKTNVLDFSQFLVSLSEKNKNKSILEQETIKLMFNPQSNNGKQALGWSYSSLDDIFMKKLNNGNIVGHTGSDPGVFSMALYNPKKGNGLVIFMNQNMELKLQTVNIYMMIKRLVKEAEL